MRILPSIPAAVVAGAVVMPLFMVGMNYLEERQASPVLIILWFVVGFFVPLAFSTADMSHVIAHWRQEGFYRPMASEHDFRLFYYPAWTRMAVWFASCVVSVFSLKALGVAL